ncbi:MAG: glycosyl hydrolase, partial [Gemmatimonadota bacterium]|nr:glycosyl hydrolase [Gemmatimonadota bacterium]
LDRPGERWERIGENLPTRVGDIGFPVVAHPRDADTVWVFPMDGTAVWPRTSPGGNPAVFRSRNGGRTWTRQAKGFPASQGWFTVFRQAMKSDTRDPVGLYLGTTAGEIWASRDEGASWKRVAAHLPRILALEVVER